MSNEQKPSVADMDVALKMVPNATGILQVHLAEILARVRREARAEAFEEAAASCFDLTQARSEMDTGIPTSGEYQIGCGDCQRKALALAAKERAS